MNVVNTEDIVKYLPSLQIRKRYIGDRNAIIAARTSSAGLSVPSETVEWVCRSMRTGTGYR